MACVGIITNVNQMFFSFVIGLSQGLQLIASYNYGGGMFLSLTRQIIFLLPLIVILPLIMGIDGIMYAGPIADGLAAVVAVIMIKREFSEENYRK